MWQHQLKSDGKFKKQKKKWKIRNVDLKLNNMLLKICQTNDV